MSVAEQHQETGTEPLVFSTTIKPTAFIGLSVKNALLNIVTLTFYRFWAKTEVRRRVWSNVRLNGEAFEYTGRGLELFFGFVFALLFIGLPFLSVVLAANFVNEMFVLLIFPMYLGMFVLWGFGIYSAFRYLASRTTWRGVRFQLKGGSATTYGVNYLGYMVLNGITLGWTGPHATRRLAAYVWEDLRFGNLKTSWSQANAESKGVYGAFAVQWISIPLLILGFYAAIAFVPDTLGLMEPDPEMVGMDLGLVALMYGTAGTFLLLYVWLSAPYHAAMLRSIAAGVKFGPVRFALDVKAVPLAWLITTNFFYLFFSLGFLMPFVQARTAKFIVERLSATGETHLAEAAQVSSGPRTGEGLADAFGFSMI